MTAGRPLEAAVRALLLLLLLLPSVAMAGPHTLAVLYFENQGNAELEPLKVGLAQMLISDLQGTEGVKVIERAKLQALLDELELGHSGRVDPATAARVGKLLGAEWMLMGSYFELMGTLRIDARLVNVETGEILMSEGRDGKKGQFMSMQKELAGVVRADLLGRAAGSGASSRSDTPPLDKPRPSTPTAIVREDAAVMSAAVAYSEGLIHLDRKEVSRARESFEKALVSNPDLAAARAELKGLEI